MSLPIHRPDLGRTRLGACGIIDGDGVDVFDRYARLAATLVGTPMAAISFLNGGFWCKSVIGLKSYDMTRCGMFCAQTMLADNPLLVTDATADSRFADSPMVRGASGVRFYLGAPLRTPDGKRIGAVSAFAAIVRTATPDMVARLVDLADVVVTTLELYKTIQEVKILALTDALTGLSNRVHLYQALATAWDDRRPVSLLFIDCDNFKRLNDNLGHLAGDQTLQVLASMLQDCLRPGELAARLGGDEFVILLPDVGARAARLIADRILLGARELTTRRGWPITLSIGVATFVVPPATAEMALALADEAMYDAKNAGGDRVSSVAVGDRMALLAQDAIIRQASS